MDWQLLFRETWQTTLVFFALLVFTRCLGKTQIGQLTFNEYVSGITIGSIAGNMLASEQDKFFYHGLLYSLCHLKEQTAAQTHRRPTDAAH